MVVVSYVRRPVILYETEYLPSLGGFPTAHSINDLGQVVMSRVILSPTAAIQTQIYIWGPNEAEVELGPFMKGFVSDLRVNDAGQISGMFGHPNTYQQPFFWDPNNGLTRFGQRSKMGNRITGMNSAGQVIGYDRKQRGQRDWQSFLWGPGMGMTDLGSLGGGGTVAQSINDKGQIAGLSISISPTHRKQAFLWDKSEGMSGIDGIELSDVHINNNGQVFGAPFIRNRRMIELVSWHKDVGHKTLATFNGFWGDVSSVNDTGQVLLVIRRKGFRVLKYILFDRREYWLWDPQRGKTRLAKQVRCKEGYFRPVDINNNGWILGSISDKHTNRPLRWLLLKPIEEMWKESLDEN
jgi:probable HAF family extracellular repeat protein